MSSQPPTLFEGLEWSRIGQPTNGYEEWIVEFGCLPVRLYHNIDKGSEGYDTWGAEIGSRDLSDCVDLDESKLDADSVLIALRVAVLEIAAKVQSVRRYHLKKAPEILYLGPEYFNQLTDLEARTNALTRTRFWFEYNLHYMATCVKHRVENPFAQVERAPGEQALRMGPAGRNVLERLSVLERRAQMAHEAPATASRGRKRRR